MVPVDKGLASLDMFNRFIGAPDGYNGTLLPSGESPRSVVQVAGVGMLWYHFVV